MEFIWKNCSQTLYGLESKFDYCPHTSPNKQHQGGNQTSQIHDFVTHPSISTSWHPRKVFVPITAHESEASSNNFTSSRLIAENAWISPHATNTQSNSSKPSPYTAAAKVHFPAEASCHLLTDGPDQHQTGPDQTVYKKITLTSLVLLASRQHPPALLMVSAFRSRLELPKHLKPNIYIATGPIAADSMYGHEGRTRCRCVSQVHRSLILLPEFEWRLALSVPI